MSKPNLAVRVQTADQPFPGVPNLSKPRAIQPLKILIFPAMPHECHFSRFSAPHPVRSHVQIFDLGSACGGPDVQTQTGYPPILGRFVSKLEPAFPPIKGGPKQPLIPVLIAVDCVSEFDFTHRVTVRACNVTQRSEPHNLIALPLLVMTSNGGYVFPAYNAMMLHSLA